MILNRYLYFLRPSLVLLVVPLVLLQILKYGRITLPVMAMIVRQSSNDIPMLCNRRTFVASELLGSTCTACIAATSVVFGVSPTFAVNGGDIASSHVSSQEPQSESTTTTTSSSQNTFASKAYGLQEYTNSIVASRDTNISPAEAYDIIRQQIPMAKRNNARAADIGAGAGLSTTILYAEKGYHSIAAVDWSRSAWDTYAAATNDIEPREERQSVNFYEMDDDSFFSSLRAESTRDDAMFDVIVYNFAINKEKAVQRARDYLSTDGLLLAPCNDRKDYWYKQSYMVFDNTGTTVWTSGAYIDAWLIQFQPDVTSTECTGIWCGNFNGFFEKRRQQQDSIQVR